jgi:hypothetical protein
VDEGSEVTLLVPYVSIDFVGLERYFGMICCTRGGRFCGSILVYCLMVEVVMEQSEEAMLEL